MRCLSPLGTLQHVTVRVDTNALQQRLQQRAHREGTGVDALVVVEGRPVTECVELVRAATDRLGGKAVWTVYPTTGGALVWVEGPQDLQANLAALGEVLSDVTGADVEITIPPRPVGDPRRSDAPIPTAFLAHSMDPPLSEGPFNEWGAPQSRWGVSAGPSRVLASHASDWACAGAHTEVLGIVPIPTDASTAPDLLSQTLTESRQRTGMVATTKEGTPFRSLTVEHFGQSAWSDADESTSSVARAEALLDLAVDMAADLDIAVVHPAVPSVTTWRSWRVPSGPAITPVVQLRRGCLRRGGVDRRRPRLCRRPVRLGASSAVSDLPRPRAGAGSHAVVSASGTIPSDGVRGLTLVRARPRARSSAT